MFFLITLLALAQKLALILAQLSNETHYSRIQPILSASLALKCCKNSSGSGLADCLDDATFAHRMLRVNVEEKSALNVYTYVTDNIATYSVFVTAVNAVYAEQNGYNFHILGRQHHLKSRGYSAEENPYKKSHDPRWNKIHILLHALEDRLSVADNSAQDNIPSQSSYIAWVDADLIVLDLSMRIETIGEMYPEADLIMSRDLVHAEFVSNTGFIIIRCSTWSLWFLRRWWNTYDRTKCCDQNAFTWLYDKLELQDLKHIQILRADAINSDFPAWKNQMPWNQVLHLAGASSLYRVPIFQSAFHDICRAWDEQQNMLQHMETRKHNSLLHLSPTIDNTSEGPPQDAHVRPRPQLGLSADVLRDHIIQLGHKRITALTSLVAEIHTFSANHIQSSAIATAIFSGPVRQFFPVFDFDFPRENEFVIIAEKKSSYSNFGAILLETFQRLLRIQRFQEILVDIVKLDHDESWELIQRNRAQDTEQPSLIEIKLLEKVNIWFYLIYRNVALDLVQFIGILKRCHSGRSALSCGVGTGLCDVDSASIGSFQEDAQCSAFLKAALVISASFTSSGHVLEPATADTAGPETDTVHAFMHKLALEAMKDTVSRAFEVVLSLESSKTVHSIELRRFILLDLEVNILLPMAELAPPTIKHKLLYYQFKQQQLLASTYTNDLSSDKQRDSVALSHGIRALNIAAQSWTDMAALNYYGSDYVLADPYKEGADVFYAMGTLQCMTGLHRDGILSLTKCVNLQERTIAGYDDIRIASRKDVVDSQISLVETLLSLGVCLVQKWQTMEDVELLDVSIFTDPAQQVDLSVERDETATPTANTSVHDLHAASQYFQQIIEVVHTLDPYKDRLVAAAALQQLMHRATTWTETVNQLLNDFEVRRTSTLSSEKQQDNFLVDNTHVLPVKAPGSANALPRKVMKRRKTS